MSKINLNPPSADQFDNWKDYAESGMSWLADEQDAQTIDELLRRAETEDDGLLWKAIAKKGDRKRSAAVLLAALKKFSGNEAGDDAMRHYALEAIFDLYCITKKPVEDDQLFLDLFTKPYGDEKWLCDFEILSEKVNQKIKSL